MKADARFLNQPKHFWANVRSISEQAGYTHDGRIHVPSLQEIKSALAVLSLTSAHIADESNRLTKLGQMLLDYYAYRASTLEDEIEPLLMDAEEAKALYRKMHSELKPKCPIPMNKQRGKKKAPAYFTGIINMIVEKFGGGLPCEYDPRRLTTVTVDNAPLRTLARRVDGAFPSAVNPIAVWEIKEYYYTTTFGSRVADAVYETLLDGMELEELQEHENIQVLHYLMVDSHFTWWKCGGSYLCRLVDMLHMGYVDEVLFGREVVNRLPAIVGEWVTTASRRG